VIAYTWFICVYFVAYVAVNALLITLATFQVHRYKSTSASSAVRRTLRSPLAPPIAVLVPAYNEEPGIADTVRSLLALDYPHIEVVVINDGSADETLQRLTEAFDLREVRRPTPPFVKHARVRGVYAPRSRLRLLVIDKENGGKADSLNAGINFTTCQLVCSVDADSILEQDALAKAALPFIEDPGLTVASGGLVRVANGCRIERGRVTRAGLPRSRFAMFQVVEYMRSFFGTRTGWTQLNALLIVSGAFGLFRRDAVIAVGGYRTDTMGEDMELVVRLHRSCRDARRKYRIVYVPDPVCWTEAPETARILRRQRRRWQRGSLEVLLFHRGMLFNPRYRAVGLIALPSLLLFDILGPVLELSGYLLVVIGLLLGLVSPMAFALFLVLAVLYGMIVTLAAAVLEDATMNRHPAWSDLRRILLYAVAESFGYRQLGHLWRVEGIWQLVRKSEWGAMERKGLSRPGPAPPTPAGPAAGPLRELERQGHAVEGVRARAVPLLREALDDLHEHAAQPLCVLREDGEHLGLRHALALLHARVGVGDQGHRGVAERQFAGQAGLGQGGHPDQRPALRGVPARLGPGGEPRALDDDERPRRHRRPARIRRRRYRAGPADRAVRVGELDVHRAALVVERLRPARGPVRELVRHRQRARPVDVRQRADGAGRDHLPHPDRAQRPQVGAVGDAVRREPVAAAVPRQEGHPPPGHLPDHHRVAGHPERGLDRDLVDGLEELVQPGAADDGDAGQAGSRGRGRAGRAGHGGSGDLRARGRRGRGRRGRTGRRPGGDLVPGLLVAAGGLVPGSPGVRAPRRLGLLRVRPLRRGQGGLGGLTAVGPVEAGALEDDADGREDLAKLATARRADGQGVIGELLHDLEPLCAIGAGVLVRRHGSSLCGAGPGNPGAPPRRWHSPQSTAKCSNS
jgi:cellulose synthase/poly-beta-1,6-N-acetylglucosamine synthase-like glycosyltransferase